MTSGKTLQSRTNKHGEQRSAQQKLPEAFEQEPPLASLPQLDPLLLTPRTVLQLQRTVGNQQVQRLLAPNAISSITKPSIQRVWNGKCLNGGPDNFDPDAALAKADFSNCTYVNLAKAVVQGWNYTVYAYTYVTVQDSTGRNWRVCMVAHVHLSATTDGRSKRWEKALDDANWGPGNCFIPGWDGWEVPTPGAVKNTLVAAWKNAVSEKIKPINPGSHAGDLLGAFPGNNRYPQLL